jgi:hypothetical protein
MAIRAVSEPAKNPEKTSKTINESSIRKRVVFSMSIPLLHVDFAGAPNAGNRVERQNPAVDRILQGD